MHRTVSGLQTVRGWGKVSFEEELRAVLPFLPGSGLEFKNVFFNSFQKSATYSLPTWYSRPESFGIVVGLRVGTEPDIAGLASPSFRPKSGVNSKIYCRAI